LFSFIKIKLGYRKRKTVLRLQGAVFNPPGFHLLSRMLAHVPMYNDGKKRGEGRKKEEKKGQKIEK
jgi:hypothetical protein